MKWIRAIGGRWHKWDGRTSFKWWDKEQKYISRCSRFVVPAEEQNEEPESGRCRTCDKMGDKDVKE